MCSLTIIIIIKIKYSFFLYIFKLISDLLIWESASVWKLLAWLQHSHSSRLHWGNLRHLHYVCFIPWQLTPLGKYLLIVFALAIENTIDTIIADADHARSDWWPRPGVCHLKIGWIPKYHNPSNASRALW